MAKSKPLCMYIYISNADVCVKNLRLIKQGLKSPSTAADDAISKGALCASFAKNIVCR